MKKIFLGMLSLAFVFTSCNNDDDAQDTTANVTVNINGLEDLGANFAYEGWVLVDGSPVSTGTFTVDANGAASATSFELPAATLADATKFILTVEPSPDDDPAPSAQKLIAGDFSGSSASLSTAVAPAVGDFSNAAGSFFMRTPTDEAGGLNNGNDEYGVWFGVPGAPPTPDFVLPTLPDGWAYEGWVVVDGVGPISTGTFTDFNTVDMFDGFSGSNPGPPVPGEDFFNNAPAGFTFPLDVRNRTVVISVEPVPDNSPAPFVLKPLVGTAGTDTAPASYPFSFNGNSLPTGTVTR
nr:anti-sigma factor [Bacteroidota bacterium]